MVHHVCGTPLLYSSGAPDIGAPLMAILLMAHLVCGAPLLVLSWPHTLPRLSSGAPGESVPLLVLTSNGAPHPRCATTNNFFFFFSKLVMAHHTPGVPLVTLVTNGAFLGGAPLGTWEQLDIFDSQLPH